MKLAPRIAFRYLFARKSHNVINIISAIGAAGMAVGTAALILILSVYNGFDGIIRDNLSTEGPSLLVAPAAGRTFVPEGEAFDALSSAPEVSSVCNILADNVFVDYEGRQSLAYAKGVDSRFEEENPLGGKLVAGEWRLHRGELEMAAVGSALAYKLGVNPRFTSPIRLYYPDRKGVISPTNPLASLHSATLYPSCTLDLYTSATGYDSEGVLLVPIETMRILTGSPGEVSGVEIRLKDGLSGREIRRFTRRLRTELGSGFAVRDRYMQHEAIYKMMRWEKTAIFLILFFIVGIIALNIYGSLSMLIIEKQEDMATLKAMGASDALIRRIFVLEGWFISLLGMAAGLAVGLAIALLQPHFGFVKMPGSFLVDAYPVAVRLKDVILTAGGVSLIGFLIALRPVARRA